LFVDQKGAVGCHTGHEQGLLRSEQIKLGEEFLGGDLGSNGQVPLTHFELFACWLNAYNFIGSLW